ncbi:sugar ABC transporter substrate-binding protein [Microbacterium sp. EYE_5]|uniref:ABC transporter substrate-binding protein n=1 Tax=unclassified Microbacterium TaxID=2609290 RepID=UPI0020037571|nr:MULTISPECIES: sugar ABC transporter substrate-binding protein [unclassified Microbacterium]MCK6079400.1 sugar ABC transporter substrate-binding protein [Microbacterium sp. EYE_382]MCK6084670.1 sugar ABC transporter substrate-binding protein [Microbacterium sp. EYE_384]MCK6123101.1 sugar ABC transporter substrate-binding protein [Microbacterium sp. EYE_80]MCK6125434.1 sugar ABC transporter substrate-binding protein [Microbacterium sp. EYE_79]MCK6140354.1 sugar ABC transporter substrate-bindi
MARRALRARRTAIVLGTFVTTSALLAGCTGGGGGGNSSGETTLDVYMGAGDMTDEQIATFEDAHPGVAINIIPTDPARLNTMLASGNPPDVAFGNALGSANVNARGLATDLTPYLEKSEVLKEDDLQAVNDGFRWNGERSGEGPLYGIVKDWSQDNALWYNTSLFDKAGVPYLSDTEPITYDELLEIAKKLAVVDGGTTEVYGLGMEWAWTLYGPLAVMVEQQGGSLFSDDLSEVDFTTPEAQKALQWFVDFGQSGVGPTSLNPLPDGSDFSTFAANRMAISQDGYWFGGNFAADDAMKTVRFAPAPTMGDEPIGASFGGAGLWIPEQSDSKDLAWEFLEWWLGGEPAEARASSGWGLPSLKSLSDRLPQEQPFQQQAYEVVQNQLQYTAPLPDSPYISAEALQGSIDKYLQQAIKGELTVEEAGTQLTDELNETLAKGKDQVG